MLERMCIICRAKAPKRRGGLQGGGGSVDQLLRLVAVKGELTVDRAQNLPGRGAYVHTSTDCVVKLGQVGRIARALRIPEGVLSASSVRQVVEELLQGELLRGGSPAGSGASKGKGSGKRDDKRIRL